MEEVNSRVHRSTLEVPKDMLRVLERPRLHPVPEPGDSKFSASPPGPAETCP